VAVETVAIHGATLYLLINNVAPCIHIFQPSLLLGDRSLVASYPRGVDVHVHAVHSSFMDINHCTPVGSDRVSVWSCGRYWIHICYGVVSCQ